MLQMPSLMGTTASQPQQPQSPALFVKGLSKGITERHLYAVFSQFGQLVDCQIARHRSGRSAGFAIITYASMAEAQAALVADNHYLCGRRLQLRWYSATDGTSSTSRQQVLGRDLLLGQLVSPMLGSGLRMPAHQAILGGSAYPETSWLLQNDSFNDSFQSASASALLSQPHQLMQLRQALQMSNHSIQSAPQLVLSGMPPAVPQTSVQQAAQQLAATPASLLAAQLPPAAPSTITTQLGRRSLDDTAVLPSVHMAARRRSSRASLGLNLDGLDLSNFRFLESDTGEELPEGQQHKWGLALDLADEVAGPGDQVGALLSSLAAPQNPARPPAPQAGDAVKQLRPVLTSGNNSTSEHQALVSAITGTSATTTPSTAMTSTQFMATTSSDSLFASSSSSELGSARANAGPALPAGSPGALATAAAVHLALNSSSNGSVGGSESGCGVLHTVSEDGGPQTAGGGGLNSWPGPKTPSKPTSMPGNLSPAVQQQAISAQHQHLMGVAAMLRKSPRGQLAPPAAPVGLNPAALFSPSRQPAAVAGASAPGHLLSAAPATGVMPSPRWLQAAPHTPGTPVSSISATQLLTPAEAQLQSSLVQQAQQAQKLNAAQQQYANALAQLTAAQNQVLAASAALQQHHTRPHAGLIPGTHALASMADSLTSGGAHQSPGMYLASANIPATFQGLF